MKPLIIKMTHKQFLQLETKTVNDGIGKYKIKIDGAWYIYGHEKNPDPMEIEAWEGKKRVSLGSTLTKNQRKRKRKK